MYQENSIDKNVLIRNINVHNSSNKESIHNFSIIFEIQFYFRLYSRYIVQLLLSIVCHLTSLRLRKLITLFPRESKRGRERKCGRGQAIGSPMKGSGKSRNPSITGRCNYEGDRQRRLSVTWHGRTRHDWVFTCGTVTRATINPQFVHRVMSKGGEGLIGLTFCGDASPLTFHFLCGPCDANFPMWTEPTLWNIYRALHRTFEFSKDSRSSV